MAQEAPRPGARPVGRRSRATARPRCAADPHGGPEHRGPQCWGLRRAERGRWRLRRAERGYRGNRELGAGRREDGRPQRGTPAGPCGPCVSWATSMGGSAIGRGPAAAGPVAVRPPGVGSLSTWPGMASLSPGEIASGPVRRGAGLGERAAPAAPAELAGPVQPGTDRLVPWRAAGAARRRGARSEAARTGTDSPFGPLAPAASPAAGTGAIPPCGHTRGPACADCGT